MQARRCETREQPHAGTMRVTHLGTASLLLEIGSLRIVTDPALDPKGREYAFRFGRHSTNTDGATATLPELAQAGVDAVLLSHDQHADNLDDAGRGLIKRAGVVLTTRPAARRLGGNAVGLRSWKSHDIVGESGFVVRVTATPARHGPPLSRGLVGASTGFVLEWPGQSRGAVYITGDTVLYGGVKEVAERFAIGTVFIHAGGVQFPKLSGRVLYTMDTPQALRVTEIFGQAQIIPVHYDGWTHFLDPREALQQQTASNPRVCWLDKGTPTALDS